MKKFLKIIKIIFRVILIAFVVMLALGFIVTKLNCNNNSSENISIYRNQVTLTASADSEIETQELPNNLSGAFVNTVNNTYVFYAGGYILKNEVTEIPTGIKSFEWAGYAVFTSNLTTKITNFDVIGFRGSMLLVTDGTTATYLHQKGVWTTDFENTRLIFFTVDLTTSIDNYTKWLYQNLINLKYYDQLTEAGKEEGYKEGEQAGYNKGFTEGQQEGYTNGFNAGKDEGYKQGYTEGTETTDGYKEGYENGYNTGKEEGKAEGAELAQYGIFQNATVDAVFDYGDAPPEAPEQTITITKNGLTPIYVSNGINTNAIWKSNEIYNNGTYDYTLESANLIINLSKPFIYSNDSPILINGPSVSLLDQIILIDTNNNQYYAQIEYNSSGKNYSKVSEKELSQMGLIKAIKIGFGRASDTLKNVTIAQDNGNYLGGYTSGYNNGLTDGKEEGYENGYGEGYDKGYDEGESQGYTNAVAEGTTQSGIFYGAIAFTKMFFQLGTQFLGTKIAGDITLGLIVIGLPCAFMIINLGIGLVKKLLGGKGASEG